MVTTSGAPSPSVSQGARIGLPTRRRAGVPQILTTRPSSASPVQSAYERSTTPSPASPESPPVPESPGASESLPSESSTGVECPGSESVVVGPVSSPGGSDECSESRVSAVSLALSNSGTQPIMTRNARTCRLGGIMPAPLSASKRVDQPRRDALCAVDSSLTVVGDPGAGPVEHSDVLIRQERPEVTRRARHHPRRLNHGGESEANRGPFSDTSRSALVSFINPPAGSKIAAPDSTSHEGPAPSRRIPPLPSPPSG